MKRVMMRWGVVQTGNWQHDVLEWGNVLKVVL